MKNIVISAAFGGVALAAGIICHRVAPGLGLVLMPMFWPLVALAAKVPTKHAVITAAIVPMVAFALSGMPAEPVVVAVKFALFTGAASLFFRRVLAKVR